MADRTRYENRMSNMDAMMWRMEKDPMLRSTITALFVFDSAPDRDAVVDKVDRATRLVPRLRQRVVGNPMSLVPPRWEVDPNFDLHYHLRWVNAPGGGTVREVLDMVEPIAMAGFDRARPLWEFTIVEAMSGGRAALVFKLNHAVSDGVGLVSVAPHIIDLDADAHAAPMPPAPEARVLSPWERVVDGTRHELAHQREAWLRRADVAREIALHPLRESEALRDMTASVAKFVAPASEHLSDLLTPRSLSVQLDVMDLPLDGLKRAAKAANGKLNDAFVAAVCGGFARYHARMDADVKALRMAMPINVRSDETRDLAGNQFVPARFNVPTNVVDPAERMLVIRNLVGRERREPALQLMEPVATLINRVPSTLVHPFFGAVLKGVDFFTSNVPGLPVPVYLGGARLEASYAFGPLTGSAANLTILSYCDGVHLGINSDPAAVTDREGFLECLDEGFAEVLALA